ncbi:secondary thiamine-phosphate synthase enzyme YjbQ [Phycisphaera mikurensis]|uniref:YjbQ family protein n=1 Tax=Phycisphaera mikurensis (strain NBRC 102666 / KCTC 22515 / FYK2301M01) TaxID=1142394 RepID=I0ID46_PHYMF|nr:secondary thiamine-phosphate synthase enzyme YjbQ [Phycisphaera mikurensis]MBB6442308.1 secondary thiamine-phosphate synthase enzyme [Phycisphaera mikurensis]BAM03184.1 hypothetical protein PSMK_10250 [Phycisphaera mikurensis NBRC 102666]
MESFTVDTPGRDGMVEITDRVAQAISRSARRGGVAQIFVMHTTAGLCVNENADPDVVHDLLKEFDRLFPWEQPFHRHAEGNTAAHAKAILTGNSIAVPLRRNGRLDLGTWQGIYLCEFDGPRTRTVKVVVLEEANDDKID